MPRVACLQRVMEGLRPPLVLVVEGEVLQLLVGVNNFDSVEFGILLHLLTGRSKI